MPPLPFPFRLIQNLLRRLNYHYPAPRDIAAEEFYPKRIAIFEEALRQLPTDAPNYLATHIGRLARTLAMVPAPATTGGVLELGCYMQITPLLQTICGYREVRGAYYGPAGKTDSGKSGDFTCEIDLFDAEKDAFPYQDGCFDLVIAGEVIEHLIHDPMHLLLEVRRVLTDGGFLLLTTPNIGSLTSVARTLDGLENPQIFSLYTRPNDQREIGHMREYTAHEIGEAVHAAGFEVTKLFTTFIKEFATYLPLLSFLAANGYSTDNRGEQTWCLARKNTALPVDRYPRFLYVS